MKCECTAGRILADDPGARRAAHIFLLICGIVTLLLRIGYSTISARMPALAPDR